jgi:hypothetical protein
MVSPHADLNMQEPIKALAEQARAHQQFRRISGRIVGKLSFMSSLRLER